jgi:hypothetical protein
MEHEIKTKTISNAQFTANLSWIIVELTPSVSLVSFFGTITVSGNTGGLVPAITLADEPLFSRFVGNVDKIALPNASVDSLIGYEYSGSGLQVDTSMGINGAVYNLQDVLFFVATP